MKISIKICTFLLDDKAEQCTVSSDHNSGMKPENEMSNRWYEMLIKYVSDTK